MTDKRTEKLAELCVQYSVAIKPKETVLIRGSFEAAPLMIELYKQCLLCDAYPWLQPSIHAEYAFYKHAKDHQLRFVSPLDKFIYENMDVNINVSCDPNPKNLTSIPPAKIKTTRSSRRELMDIFYKRVGEGKLRWTLLPFPVTGEAQEAAMSLPEYEDFVYGSCLVDKKDPVAEWKKIHKEQERICSKLDKSNKIRIVGEDTDLTFRTKERKWINCSGEHNMPDGEVFTTPIEDSANGTVRFTYPGIYTGKEVEDITLTFKNGKVTKASAAKGADLLKELLKIEGANRLGEAAIGTNHGITRFTKNMLFDEKMAGTIHMALGNSYPETGGKNRSAIHWDILKDMKKNAEIYADNEIFYKNGKFLA